MAGYSDGNLFFDWDPFGEIADPKPGAFDGFVMKFNEKLGFANCQADNRKMLSDH